MPCLCRCADTDHALGEGICACGCPAYRPATQPGFDQSLVSDEEWTDLLADYVEFHRPMVVKEGPTLEIHWVGELGGEQ
jgi:hypothetical protein